MDVDSMVSSGVGGVAGAVVNGITNAIGARRNYKYNSKLQQQAQQFNAQEAQKNRDFQKQMFDETNQWNSAGAQVQRLRDAGLNPYLMMNGGDAGTATSPQGSQASSSANSFSAPVASSGEIVGNAFKQMSEQMYDRKEQAARIRQMDSVAALNDIQADVTQGRWNIDKVWLPESYDADVKYKDAMTHNTKLQSSLVPFQSQMMMAQTDYYTEYQASLRAQAVLNAMKTENIRILNKYLPGQMMAQTFTLMAQGKLFEAKAITEGVASQLQGEQLKLFRSTVNSVAAALNVQNWFNVGYYGGPQAYHQGKIQRGQEWTARDLQNKTGKLNLDFLDKTFDTRVNTLEWQNRNEKVNFVRNVVGVAGDAVKVGTMLVPGSRIGNVLFKPSAPAPAPQGSMSFF
jgi:hypothetical protein